VKRVTKSRNTALVKIGTDVSISFPAEVAGASKAAVYIGTRGVGIAVVSIVSALVDVGTSSSVSEAVA